MKYKIRCRVKGIIFGYESNYYDNNVNVTMNVDIDNEFMGDGSSINIGDQEWEVIEKVEK
jgi:hypothetical protein